MSPKKYQTATELSNVSRSILCAMGFGLIVLATCIYYSPPLLGTLKLDSHGRVTTQQFVHNDPTYPFFAIFSIGAVLFLFGINGRKITAFTSKYFKVKSDPVSKAAEEADKIEKTYSDVAKTADSGTINASTKHLVEKGHSSAPRDYVQFPTSELPIDASKAFGPTGPIDPTGPKLGQVRSFRVYSANEVPTSVIREAVNAYLASEYADCGPDTSIRYAATPKKDQNVKWIIRFEGAYVVILAKGAHFETKVLPA